MEDDDGRLTTSFRDEIVPLRILTPTHKDWPGIERPRTVPRKTSTQSILLDNKTSQTDLRIRSIGTEDTFSSLRTSWLDQTPCRLPRNASPRPHSSRYLPDLPIEVHRRIIDFISGEIHPVSSVQTYSLASSMRHPRRKAVSGFALVSQTWRELVQERIFRHIKLKGTRSSLREAADFLQANPNLARLIRHIEIWVPVWGDRTSPDHLASSNPLNRPPQYLGPADAEPAASFSRFVDASSLDEIFMFVLSLLPCANILTIEGGHCKKSNMIKRPYTARDGAYAVVVPQIRTFAMRGAWNIMRSYADYSYLALCLPNVVEWHCNYVKPRQEAYVLMNRIIGSGMRFERIRHVNLCLDGMYGKDSLGSTYLPQQCRTQHLCEELGRMLPYIESLTYTGKVCSCFWLNASASAQRREQTFIKYQDHPSLLASHYPPKNPDDFWKTHPQTLPPPPTSRHALTRHLDLIVKSCCPQQISVFNHESQTFEIQELNPGQSDNSTISNLRFIAAFERLVLATVESLDRFPLLDSLRIRFIDLDSTCAQLNPYWHLDRRTGKVTGLWSEEILEALQHTDRARFGGVEYEELGDGIGFVHGEGEGDGVEQENAPSILYPKSKPKAIKSSSYKLIAQAKGS